MSQTSTLALARLCRQSDCLQVNHEPLSQQTNRLCNARQFRSVVRVEQAADFFFVDAKLPSKLYLADAGLTHCDV